MPGGVSLELLWYGFMLTAVLLAPLAVLLGQVLGRDGLARRTLEEKGWKLAGTIIPIRLRGLVPLVGDLRVVLLIA